MAEQSEDQKNWVSKLSSAAAAERPDGEKKRIDRTTMNINDPREQAVASPPPDALGEALVERGLINRHQLFNALNESYRVDSTLREALVAMHIIDEDTLSSEGF